MNATHFPGDNYTEITNGTLTFQVDGKWAGILTTDSGRKAVGKVMVKLRNGEHTGVIRFPGEAVRWTKVLTLVFGD